MGAAALLGVGRLGSPDVGVSGGGAFGGADCGAEVPFVFGEGTLTDVRGWEAGDGAPEKGVVGAPGALDPPALGEGRCGTESIEAVDGGVAAVLGPLGRGRPPDTEPRKNVYKTL